MFEKVFDVLTPEGSMNTYLYAPDEGGPFPLVLYLMDSAGVREPLADMCRRLASTGYCVVMPNLYYRRVHYLDIDVDRLHDPAYGEQTAHMWRLNQSLTNTMVMKDLEVLLDHLKDEEKCRPGPIGLLGYCMSGPFVYRAAAVFADRVAAAVAMYGSPMVSTAEDSAHLTSAQIKGEIYFGFAENEVHFSTSKISQSIREQFAGTNVRYRIEIYSSREHGFALPGRRVYHKNSAERHWVRVQEIFRRALD